jgi:hypothetical protein
MKDITKTLERAIYDLKSLLPSRKNTTYVTYEGVDLEVLFDEYWSDEIDNYCYIENIYISGVEVTDLLDKVGIFDEIIQTHLDYRKHCANL